MREITNEVNRDLGVDTLTRAGVHEARRVPIAAAFSNLNNLDASGLYPVLFNAVLDLTRSPDQRDPVFDQARARILGEPGTTSPDDVYQHVIDTWLRICGTAPPLRPEIVRAFAEEGSQGLRSALAGVSSTARLRSGLHYLNFALAALAAAGIDHLHLMIDQLEDLATTRTITAAKRSREIGRIRDMLEGPPYANRVHFVFTFHNSAARVLERFWEANRLPPFEVSPSNAASVVVLRGLNDDTQVSDLLRVYLNERRDGPVEDESLPFDSAAITALRRVSDGRVGILLNRARELLEFAAEQGVPRITSDFADGFFAGTNTSGTDPVRHDAPSSEESDIDDLLLGTR